MLPLPHFLLSPPPPPPLGNGPRCCPVPPVSRSSRDNHAPPPSHVAPQCHLLCPMVGGHCRPLHAIDRCIGPLSAPSPAPTRHQADPPPFPSPTRASSAFKSRWPPTSLHFSLFFFSARSARRRLPAHPLSLSASFPVASPPHHRETEPPPASTFHPPPLSEPGPLCVVACMWHAPHLLPLLWCCRTPPLVPPLTGAPPPPWDIAALPHQARRLCSGEPSPLPPHQSHRRLPHCNTLIFIRI
jgi:hypothetical protein